MSIPRVVIAGAGIAGLTLGRCLLSKGIRALIVEKASLSPRRHDYSIELYSWAYKPLLDILGTEETTFIEKLSVSPHISTVATSMTPTLQSDCESSKDRFRCHRGKLEALLSDGLEIRWDHAITKVLPGPRHIAIDVDGKPPIRTNTLIAADGVHSTIRTCLVPEAHPEVHRYAVFYGTRIVPKEAYPKMMAPQMQDRTAIELRQDDVLLRIFINDTTATDLHLGYTYSRPARLGLPTDPLFKPCRPPAGAKDVPEAFYTELGYLRDLEPAYAEVFNPVKVQQDRVLHWLMRSVAPSCSQIRAPADVNVVMIGDAVHAMPILGSRGANMAIKDGVELAEWIARQGTEHVGRFSGDRHQEWMDGVEQGVKRLKDMHEGHRAAL